jgi:hypothetical protein
MVRRPRAVSRGGGHRGGDGGDDVIEGGVGVARISSSVRSWIGCGVNTRAIAE